MTEIMLKYVLPGVALFYIVFGGWTIWLATRNGDGRRLEFFMFGESTPPSTASERADWLRGM